MLNHRWKRGLSVAALFAAWTFLQAPPCAEAQLNLLGGNFLGGNAKTLGGRFAWSDIVIYRDWRIQKNALVGHYRLIDPDDKRIAFGTLETCLTQFDRIKREESFPPLPEEVIVMLHGLGAGRQFMEGIAEYLNESGGYTVVNMGYASTMGSIAEHAQSLDSVIRHLDGAKRISFVAHSMGNIVTRRYLYDVAQLDAKMRPAATFERMVMISPPNHGAEIADDFEGNKLAEFAVGTALQELAPTVGWPALEQRLVTPQFPFGIIVGGRANDAGYLPNVPGDDDFLLSIETQKLKGAADYLQTKGVHQLMPRYKEVREATLRFLQHGYFVTEEARQPL